MKKETLSLLMDGEQIDSELLDILSVDKSMQEEWLNYHLIREVLRGGLHATALTLDIAKQVAMRIEQEPVPVVSPAPHQQAAAMNWLGNIKSRITAWSLPSFAGQMGIAACTALVVIIGVQQLSDAPVEEGDSPILSTMPIGLSVSPVGFNTTEMKPHTDLEQEEKDKIYLMLQDYEQQRRQYAE